MLKKLVTIILTVSLTSSALAGKGEPALTVDAHRYPPPPGDWNFNYPSADELMHAHNACLEATGSKPFDPVEHCACVADKATPENATFRTWFDVRDSCLEVEFKIDQEALGLR